jgi:hypothetical protein
LDLLQQRSWLACSPCRAVLAKWGTTSISKEGLLPTNDLVACHNFPACFVYNPRSDSGHRFQRLQVTKSLNEHCGGIMLPKFLVTRPFANVLWAFIIALPACSKKAPDLELASTFIDQRPVLLAADLFRRDQPEINRVFGWDDQIVVSADCYYKIDLEKATASPLSFPKDHIPLALAMSGKRRPLALCRNSEGLCLILKDQDKWVNQVLPKEVRESTKGFSLVTDETSTVLINNDYCFRNKEGQWRSVTVKKRPGGIALIVGSQRHLLHNNTLYVGYDAGEWGGVFLSLNLLDGEWKMLEVAGIGDPFHPVKDLKVDPQGRLWVASGLAHLGGVQGCLHFEDGNDWKLFASTSNSQGAKPVNWNLAPTTMEGIAFDEKGRLYVHAQELGIVRFENDEWSQVIPGWPKDQFISSFHVTDQGFIVIGMPHAGVLLYDPRGNEIRRIGLTSQGTQK